MSPASTIMRSSPSSKTIMFLPISPSPPRGMTRSLSTICSDKAHLLGLAVHLADCVARGEPGQGVAAQTDDELGPDDLDLLLQVLAAGVDLAGKRVAVAGRAALDDVGDEYLLPPEADGGDQFVQEAAGRANEGAGPLVLVEAGRLTHEQQFRVGRTFTGDGVGGGAAAPAVGAGSDAPVQLFELAHELS